MMADRLEDSFNIAGLLIAEKWREATTRDSVIPFKTGDLRKSIITTEQRDKDGVLIKIGSNLPYAQAVHDGRPALTIRPKYKKALFWKGAPHPMKAVKQKAREGRPYLIEGLKIMQAEGFAFLDDPIRSAVELEIDNMLKGFK